MAKVGFVLAALAFPGSIAASPPARLELRPLLGMDGWGWVKDSTKLEKKLAFARTWGYNAFIFAFDGPQPLDARGDSNWVRDPADGFRWKLARGSRPRHADARAVLQDRIRAVKAAADRQGLLLIPSYGPMGWGGSTVDVDPSAAAGAYFDLSLPPEPANRFLLRSADPDGVVDSMSHWGEAPGGAECPVKPGGAFPGGSIRVTGKGSYQAHFVLRPGAEAYWRLAFEVEGKGKGGADSVSLRVYRFRGWESHPLSTKRLAHAGIRLSAGSRLLETGFFSRKDETFFVDLGLHSSSPGGGTLVFRQPDLRMSAPPRELLVDASAYEARGPGGLSLLERAARSGFPLERGGFTVLSSDKLGLKEARFFQLDGRARDKAWKSMTRIRGHFAEPGAEAHRRAVDPLSPAARQIFLEVTSAAAEALGRPPRYHHLGGDEVFSLSSRRLSRPPYRSMGKGEKLAEMFKERVREVDALYGRLYPGSAGETSYIFYGDMFTSGNGYGEGTLDGLKWLASSDMEPGKVILMPWHYDGAIRSSAYLYKRHGFPEGLTDLEKFEELIRRDARAISRSGLDFLGLYSTDASEPTVEEENGGAMAWARVCGEFQASTRGRCLGIAYAGWDAHSGAEWGNAYNGFLALARNGWVDAPGGPGGGPSLADADGDGVLDMLETMRPGPFRP